MVLLILGMLVCIGLAAMVVALVAIPARREGRDVLTPKGEEVVSAVRSKTASARARTGAAAASARSLSGSKGDAKESAGDAVAAEQHPGATGSDAPSKTDSETRVDRAG